MNLIVGKFSKAMLAFVFVAGIVASFTFSGFAHASESRSGDFGTSLHWELSDGTLTVSGSGAMPNYSIGVWVQNGAPWYEFRNDIRRVIVKEGVTSIGDSAFLCCRQMTGIKLPSTITYVGTSAFEDCDSLERLELNEGVSSLGTDIIKSTGSDNGGVTYVRIPSTVKVMPDGCLGRTYVLQTVEFLGDAPAIGEGGIFGKYFVPSNITLLCKEDAEGFNTNFWSSFKEIVRSGHKGDAVDEPSTPDVPDSPGNPGGSDDPATPGKPGASDDSGSQNPSASDKPANQGSVVSAGKYVAPAPVVLKAAKRAGKKVALIKWKKSAGADGYYVYKKVGKKFKKIATIKNAKKTSFKVKKLKRGKTYVFTVKAFKKIGNGKVITGVYDKTGVRVKMKR